MELPDKATCYKALQSKDSRFDGLIFVGVRSTGIYCRPVCPARTPKYENCTFYISAAGAQEAAYRPCLRCRPETAPQLASWRGTSNTVSRALSLIEGGALDGRRGSVERLADRLGVGERQLRRLFLKHLGASPVAVAQTRRVLFAKQLIHDTPLSMTEISLASGFNSLRRFNEVFLHLFQRPPSSLRRKSSPNRLSDTEGTVLRIRYRPPYHWDSILASLSDRAVPGVESVEGNIYKRIVEIQGQIGFIEVNHLEREKSLRVVVHFPKVQALHEILNRVKRLFDLEADIETIGLHLSHDCALAPLIARRPGLRVPGGWDDFEVAVKAAFERLRTWQTSPSMVGQFILQHGKPIQKETAIRTGLTHAFPGAEQFANSKPIAGTDAQALNTVVDSIRNIAAISETRFAKDPFRGTTIIRDVDAIPSSDADLLRVARKVFGDKMTPEDLILRAESWRPWRAYALQHLRVTAM